MENQGPSIFARILCVLIFILATYHMFSGNSSKVLWDVVLFVIIYYSDGLVFKKDSTPSNVDKLSKL